MYDVFLDIENFRKNFTIDFARELKNPVIATSDAIKIIKDITAKLSIKKLTSDFLSVITKNKRINLFPEIYEEFSRMIKIQNNILEIDIISSQKLENKDVEKIKSIINKKYPDKKIEAKEVIKKEILGGIQIKIGSDLIDASLKNQLDRLTKTLLKNIK
jgi:F-type H+-transporting ATPase subunit delta